MATPLDEQSKKPLDANITDEISSNEVQLSSSEQDTLIVETSQELNKEQSGNSEELLASEFHHHAVEEGVPSAGSAFHIVSCTDEHRNESKMDQSNSEVEGNGQTDITSLDCASTKSEDGLEKLASEKTGDSYSVNFADQEEMKCKNAWENVSSESEQLQTVDTVAQEENSLSEISKNKPDLEEICADNTETIRSAFHTSYEDENLRKLDSELLNEDVKLVQAADSKTIADFQFLKPTVMESVSKDACVVNSSVDNDVENELGGQHPVALHKPEEVLNIDEETRMGLDQTPIDPSMIEASFIYPTLPPKKLFQLDDTKDSEASDTDTKMSAVCDSEDIRLRNTISIDDATKDSAASDSNLETPTTSRKQRRASRDGLGISMMEGLEAGEKVFTAENLFEYQWPQDGGEWYLLQEQVSEYLKVKSFKRKYPDLLRRTCDKEEKEFLRDKGVVTETQSDLGLTALRSEEVYDLMMKDYNSKYKDYISHLQEKQKKVIREKHKEYSSQAKLDKTKIEAYSKKAARAAAEFNNSLMKDRKEERRAYFDLQTYTVHYPKNRFRTMPSHYTKVGPYPVALIPGQYQENYRKYSAEQLKYYPVRTSLKDPPKVVKFVQPPPSGVKLSNSDKQKNNVNSDGEGSGCTSGEDNDDDMDNVDNEIEDKENETGQFEGSDVISFVRLEKKTKAAAKRKLAKMASPDRLKKAKKLKDGEEDKEDEKLSQKVDEKGTSPDAKKKMPTKIHGLEKCRICKQRSTKEERKAGKLVKCAECGKIGHMSCLDLTEELVAVIKTYPWQCMECKTCVECLDPYDEDKMMFCDRCDRGYHTFCIGLHALPTGHWECKSCEGMPQALDKPKGSLSQGSQPVRSKKGSQASAVRTSMSLKNEPEVREDESEALTREGQAASDSQDEQQQSASLVSDSMDAPDSEKQGKTNTAAESPQVTGSRKGRRKSSGVVTPRSRGKSPKPRPSKRDKIKKARQTRRMKVKDENVTPKKKNSEKILKRGRKRSRKMQEGEESMVMENAEEMESSLFKMEMDVDEKGAHFDEFREMVNEGVDDSFVNSFDKDDDKDIELINSSSINAGAHQSDSMEADLKDNMDMSTLKLDKMATAGTSHLAEGNFQELGFTCEKDKMEQVFSLLPADTAGILQCNPLDQTSNLMGTESNGETLSVYGELQDTGYVAFSSAQQPEAVSQYQGLTVTAPTYSAPNEGFHPQLPEDTQAQLHSVPQHMPPSVAVESLTELQMPVAQSHILLPHVPAQPGALLQSVQPPAPITPHQASAEIPQENSQPQETQMQAMLPSASLATDQAALFSLPSSSTDLAVQDVDVPQEEPLQESAQNNYVSINPSMTSNHPSADDTASATTEGNTVIMDNQDLLKSEEKTDASVDNSSHEQMAHL